MVATIGCNDSFRCQRGLKETPAPCLRFSLLFAPNSDSTARKKLYNWNSPIHSLRSSFVNWRHIFQIQTSTETQTRRTVLVFSLHFLTLQAQRKAKRHQQMLWPPNHKKTWRRWAMFTVIDVVLDSDALILYC